jgi:hypothetical protein
MLFVNHALTGALLGLAIDDPLVLAPTALASHFVLDALPHFGYTKLEVVHPRWVATGIADGVVAIAAVIALCLVRPQRVGHMVLGATAAVLPDLFYIPEVLFGWHLDKWWRRLHDRIQWFEHPSGLVVDAVWLVVVVWLISRQA